MEETKLSNTLPLFDGSTAFTGESDYALNVAVAYADALTRDWAMKVSGQVTKMAGVETVHNTFWDIDRLSDPEVFYDAVGAAARADVIVIAAYAADELPLDLYVWIDAWLPRRSHEGGALVALIGVPENSAIPSSSTLKYLHAVAQKGHLDFLPQERSLPKQSAAFYMDRIAQRAHTTTDVLNRILSDTHTVSIRHWGINE